MEIYIYMKVNIDKIQQYEGNRKNIIQIGEYIYIYIYIYIYEGSRKNIIQIGEYIMM